jgi:hypothetical protein
VAAATPGERVPRDDRCRGHGALVLARRRAHSYAAAMRAAWCLVLVGCLPGCAAWFFSGEEVVDRSRPVALVETTGGVELGATTELGVLTLGTTAENGPCRVHYFLGPTPLIETGELTRANDVFCRATIDLKTQLVRVLDRALTAEDELLAMWTPDGTTTHSVTVTLAATPGVRGNVLADPAEPVPTGATVLCRAPDGTWLFVGLVRGTATTSGTGADARYVVYAGGDSVRELMLAPVPYPTDVRVKHRTDDIMVTVPAK